LLPEKIEQLYIFKIRAYKKQFVSHTKRNPQKYAYPIIRVSNTDIHKIFYVSKAVK